MPPPNPQDRSLVPSKLTRFKLRRVGQNRARHVPAASVSSGTQTDSDPVGHRSPRETLRFDRRSEARSGWPEFLRARDLAGTVFPVSEEVILDAARKHGVGRKLGRAVVFSVECVNQLFEAPAMPLKCVQRPKTPYWVIRGTIREIRVEESSGTTDKIRAEEIRARPGSRDPHPVNLRSCGYRHFRGSVPHLPRNRWQGR